PNAWVAGRVDPADPERGGRGRRQQQADRGQEREAPPGQATHRRKPLPKLAVWKPPRPVGSSSSFSKNAAGSTTPLVAILSRKCGLRPVHWSGPSSRSA